MPAKTAPVSAESASPPADIRISGLDIDALLSRIQNDRALMCKILHDFARTHEQVASRLPLLVTSDPRAARTVVHELRGTLGNIGANDLFTQAAELSRALRETRTDDALNIAIPLAEGIRALCRTLERTLPAAQPRAPTAPSASSGVDDHWRALAQHLETGRAREVHRIVDSLRDVALAPAQRRLLEQLTPLVAAYRFREASALLAAERKSG
ncbi:MAG: hypothetical protein K9L70_07780 [Thiohalocapsa sp.]|nr:hypothetical protein [Thiohalocapsa sp.]MCF7991739.1 hypothetical protein [Thiohalocapsa sp.]